LAQEGLIRLVSMQVYDWGYARYRFIAVSPCRFAGNRIFHSLPVQKVRMGIRLFRESGGSARRGTREPAARFHLYRKNARTGMMESGGLAGIEAFPRRFAGRFFSGLSFTGFLSAKTMTSPDGLARMIHRVKRSLFYHRLYVSLMLNQMGMPTHCPSVIWAPFSI
jgi:hypothetical protein